MRFCYKLATSIPDLATIIASTETPTEIKLESLEKLNETLKILKYHLCLQRNAERHKGKYYSSALDCISNIGEAIRNNTLSQYRLNQLQSPFQELRNSVYAIEYG